MNLEILEQKIGYKFNNKNLLLRAVTHSSFGEENYENFEFLGDSILGFVVAEYLLNNFDFKEGDLTKTRAKIVSANNLFTIAETLGIKDFLRLGNNYKNMQVSKNILADTVESIICAIYLDSNIQTAKEFILNKVIISYENITNLINLTIDYKTKLQEKLQENGSVKIEYISISEQRVGNDINYTIELRVNSEVLATATASSKSKAEQLCAKYVLEK